MMWPMTPAQYAAEIDLDRNGARKSSAGRPSSRARRSRRSPGPARPNPGRPRRRSRPHRSRTSAGRRAPRAAVGRVAEASGRRVFETDLGRRARRQRHGFPPSSKGSTGQSARRARGATRRRRAAHRRSARPIIAEAAQGSMSEAERVGTFAVRTDCHGTSLAADERRSGRDLVRRPSPKCVRRSYDEYGGDQAELPTATMIDLTQKEERDASPLQTPGEDRVDPAPRPRPVPHAGREGHAQFMGYGGYGYPAGLRRLGRYGWGGYGYPSVAYNYGYPGYGLGNIPSPATMVMAGLRLRLWRLRRAMAATAGWATAAWATAGWATAATDGLRRVRVRAGRHRDVRRRVLEPHVRSRPHSAGDAELHDGDAPPRPCAARPSTRSTTRLSRRRYRGQ